MKKELNVKVYFESNNHAELVACFKDEDTYIKCLPILSKLAEDSGMFITESCED
jgi:hypothetical protein